MLNIIPTRVVSIKPKQASHQKLPANKGQKDHFLQRALLQLIFSTSKPCLTVPAIQFTLH